MAHDNLLDDVLGKFSQLQGGAMVTAEGKLLSSAIRGDADLELGALQWAFLVSGAALIALAAKRGTLEQVYIKGTDGFVIGVPIDDERILIVLCPIETQLGFIYQEMGALRNALDRMVRRNRSSDDDLPDGDPLLPTPIIPPKPPSRDNAGATPEV